MRRRIRIAAAIAGALGVGGGVLRDPAPLAAQDAAPPASQDGAPPVAAVADVWSWGLNLKGASGGAPHNAAIPNALHVPSDWVGVSAGDGHTLALDAAGDVWAWGDNAFGQLGNDAVAQSALPMRVEGLDGIDRVVAGGSHSLAYRAIDATLFAWGNNSDGQLGRPMATVASSAVPTSVGPGVPLVDLAAGLLHTLVVDEDGVVWAWGDNFYGELGLSDFDARDAPVAVPGIPAMKAVSAGGSFSVAAEALDGQVWSWGLNGFGQLGRGTQGAPEQGFPVPAEVPGLTGIEALSSGGLHTLALASDRTIWAWGYNTEGQVGNGELTPANTGVLSPVHLTAPTDVVSVDTGVLNSVALTADGTAYTWGTGRNGGHGQNRRTDIRVPTALDRPQGITMISAGGRHAVALAAPEPERTLVLAGIETPGASLASSPPDEGPFEIPLSFEPIEVSLGRDHALAIDSEHRVWSWGGDSHGQLGTDIGGHDAPRAVDIPDAGSARVVQVAASWQFSLALRSDGVVLAWGRNDRGQLGLGHTDDTPTPAPVAGLPPVSEIAAGERHAYALSGDGRVWAWGDNHMGQCGRAPDAAVHPPEAIPFFVGVQKIAAGGFHGVALLGAARAVTWGDGQRAQLGQDRLGVYPTPALVALDSVVVTIAAGRFHTLFGLEGGGVAGVGDQRGLQTGNAWARGYWTPTLATGLGQSAAIVAGGYHSMAIDAATGDLVTWGNDSRGQLGRGRPRAIGREPLSIGVRTVRAAAGYASSAWLAVR